MQLIFVPIQLLLIGFLLFAFSRVILRFREGTVSPGAFLFWSGLWILAIIGVIKPQFTTWIANSLGIGRGSDIVVYISLVLLFYLVYRTNVLLENIRHELTSIVRKIAISGNDKKAGKKNKT